MFAIRNPIQEHTTYVHMQLVILNVILSQSVHAISCPVQYVEGTLITGLAHHKLICTPVPSGQGPEGNYRGGQYMGIQERGHTYTRARTHT